MFVWPGYRRKRYLQLKLLEGWETVSNNPLAAEPEDRTTAEEDQPVAATPTQQAAAEPESSQPSKKAKHE